MKFDFNFEILIGAALILWGLSIFLKLIWGIDLPVFKALAAIFLIYLGLSMLFETKAKISYTQNVHYTVKENTEEND